MDQNAFRSLLSAPRDPSSNTSTSTSKKALGGALPKRGWGTKAKDTKAYEKPKEENAGPSGKPSFAPRATHKKILAEGGYKDRAELRRKGVDDEYKPVEKLLEDFERTAKESGADEEEIRRQRAYLGGDAEHSILIKGLDYALLAARKAELAKENEEVADEELDALARDIRPGKAKGADTADKEVLGKKKAAAEKLGKGFKSIGQKEAEQSDKKKKKKKKKAVQTGDDARVGEIVKKEQLTTTESHQSTAGPSSTPNLTVPVTKVEEEEEEDIFADAGEYDLNAGLPSEDDEDEEDEAPRIAQDPVGDATRSRDRYSRSRSDSRSRSRERGELSRRDDDRRRSNSYDSRGRGGRGYSRSRSRSRSRERYYARQDESRYPDDRYSRDQRDRRQDGYHRDDQHRWDRHNDRRRRYDDRQYRRDRSPSPYADSKRRRYDSPSPPRPEYGDRHYEQRRDYDRNVRDRYASRSRTRSRDRSPPRRHMSNRSPSPRPASPPIPPARRARTRTRSITPPLFGGVPPPLSRSPSPAFDEGGNSAIPTKLAPLKSSAIADVRSFLSYDADASAAEEKRLKKAQWRARQGLGVQEGIDPEALAKKRDVSEKMKANNDYVKIMRRVEKGKGGDAGGDAE